MAAAVITYVYPVTGATAPTAAQAVGNMVVADAVFAAGATVATITHNMGVNATGADGTPEVSVVPTASGSALNSPIITFSSANAITIAQTLGTSNTDATYRVWIKRPFSETR